MGIWAAEISGESNSVQGDLDRITALLLRVSDFSNFWVKILSAVAPSRRDSCQAEKLPVGKRKKFALCQYPTHAA